ncbi:NPCBM/NEW2 domain-containing protein [Paenibacillus sp. HWE-109]|uniref:NPCBM/NEW2 domain-containing protein n=1 Tax=Paenibacillus sp. HWE-109 TaxID=1306526 RepID=UPI001EDCB50E|nr:NPCBM/NEW2 domain-containing protein [Paenibacillus sp. HWE-109]UKS25348.1 NPCBM/NEW2 domain-containing protein [Paenibacillus sp. HWE-109]
MKDKVKGFLLGTVFCTLLVGTTSYAMEPSSIEVYFRSLIYKFDGIEKIDSENNKGFVYNNTTYVPLRFISESLNKTVEWDEENNTIWIGKRTVGSINLTDLEYARATDGAINNSAFSNVNNIAGKMYRNKGIRVSLPTESSETRVVSKEGSLTYNLDDNYSRFTGAIGIDDSFKNSTALGSFRIMGDGKELYSITGLKGGDHPKPIDIDVSNISKLDFEFKRDDQEGLALDIVDGVLHH